MRKVLYILTLLFGIGLIAVQFSQPLKDFWYKRNHGGLLTTDFGIVSAEDLKFADKDSFPPYPRHEGYPYWQCFERNLLKAWCDPSHPTEKFGASLHLEIETASEVHLYALNHGVSTDICNDLLAEIHSILEHQEQFCMNGTYHLLGSNKSRTEYLWFFYRMKTKSGYAHYVYEPDMPR